MVPMETSQIGLIGGLGRRGKNIRRLGFKVAKVKIE